MNPSLAAHDPDARDATAAAAEAHGYESEQDPTEFGAPPVVQAPSTAQNPAPLRRPAGQPARNQGSSEDETVVVEGAAVDTPMITEGLISFGVPLEDRQAKKITIRVIILASAASSFLIVHFILNLLRGNYDGPTDSNLNSGVWSQLSALLIELSIPMSGYLGALYHNKQLTCCYCSCNLFLAMISISSFLRFQIRILEVHGDCDDEPDSSQRNLCLLWVENTLDKWVFLLNFLVTSALAFGAFWAGNLLYHKLSQDGEFPDLSTSPVVGEVVQLSAAFTTFSVPHVNGAPTMQVQMVTLYDADPSRETSDAIMEAATAPVQSGPQRPQPLSRAAAAASVLAAV
mmetsp:Transcript_42075/g.98075  ORF Transcript_42075/g.98075 Transcript_42075/m.98075 type:complete len:344 (-) Transcript_42075:22-1053(-)